MKLKEIALVGPLRERLHARVLPDIRTVAAKSAELYVVAVRVLAKLPSRPTRIL
jgi:hypothetical protein